MAFTNTAAEKIIFSSENFYNPVFLGSREPFSTLVQEEKKEGEA